MWGKNLNSLKSQAKPIKRMKTPCRV